MRPIRAYAALSHASSVEERVDLVMREQVRQSEVRSMQQEWR